MADKQTIQKRMNELEKKRDKYFDDYQDSGSASAQRTYEKYDDLCDICNLALKSLDEEDTDKKKLAHNLTHFIETFKVNAELEKNKTYTADEVVAILNKMKYGVCLC